MSVLIKNGRIVTAVDDYHADVFVNGSTVALIGKDLVIHAGKIGEYLKKRLLEVVKATPQLFKEWRGMGLVQGLEMTRKAGSLVSQCAKQGLLVGSAFENVLRFLPPLIIKEPDVDQAMERLKKAIEEELKATP